MMWLAQCARNKYMSQYSDPPRAGRSGDRIPVRARLSASVQINPGTHPTVGTESFLVVRRSERGYNRPPHLASRLKKE